MLAYQVHRLALTSTRDLRAKRGIMSVQMSAQDPQQVYTVLRARRQQAADPVNRVCA